jgi:Serine/threonine protein kinase
MRKNDKNFSEKEALRKFVQLVLTLEVIHSKGLIHRNLVAGERGGNLVTSYDGQTVFVTAEGDILVGGLEKAFKGDQCEEYDDYSFFSCPDLYQSYDKGGQCENYTPYDKKTDIWSSGCVLHLLLSDHLYQPFDSGRYIKNY